MPSVTCTLTFLRFRSEFSLIPKPMEQVLTSVYSVPGTGNMHISVVLHGEPGRKKNEQKEEIKSKTKSMVSPRKHSRFTAGPGLISGQSIDWRPRDCYTAGITSLSLESLT